MAIGSRADGLNPWLWILAVGIGIASAHAEDPIAAALASVRDIKADMFSQQSSVLGDLASPAECAAAQPNRREQFRTAGAKDYDFSAAQREKFSQDYGNCHFKGRPRNADCYPAGITGIHIRDILDRVELVAVAVEDDSPASGKIRVNDIILGANGRLFDDPMDPRPALGYALAYSQTPEFAGKLTLQIVRGGKPLNVSLTLPVSPAYRRTWPFACPRTGQIAQGALRCVLDHPPAAKGLFSFSDGGGFWTPLFLMASGDPEAQELVSRWAYHQSLEKDEPVNIPGGNNWIMSYNLVNLCEYYELTGDSAVLPKIRRLVKQIDLNQYTNIGTWGHGLPTGYGPINNAGLVCFMGLILARECGVEADTDVMARAIRFFGKFCGTNFPYGEGPPGGRSGRMDNGMNATSAIGFHLLGEDEMARRWARSICYMWMGREKGHAERIFPMAWGALGASMASPAEFQMYMNNLQWYYELMRTRDGGFIFSDYGSDKRGTFPYPAGSTSAIGLSLYLPEHRIRVTGARRGLFAQAPPQGLEAAATLYQQKNWKELKPLLDRAALGTAAGQKEYARDMLAALDRLDAQYRFTIGLLRKNLQSNPALAKEQLAALASLLGERRPEMAELAAQLPATIPPAAKPESRLKAVVKPCFDLFATKSR